ncbi:hypothetical protein L226DRAFT_336509 [Lentinus tigrinus ALCF2SS1-7]|uniref:REJ domain-containing protein n=1 Tax=Lentinus tigrinus ALCF2SS1-6 TaxID=1328759 RepID=A0A5C2SGJ9_9APHY|nr:hypothetical protein L227DRAFT_31901 [Lentinus tigrinus ALCF2SS1-6]RPD77922.1 hypothetical protein L226DRAFT_336509 [Lentinus tigrinus ALCF2SS1-7]
MPQSGLRKFLLLFSLSNLFTHFTRPCRVLSTSILVVPPRHPSSLPLLVAHPRRSSSSLILVAHPRCPLLPLILVARSRCSSSSPALVARSLCSLSSPALFVACSRRRLLLLLGPVSHPHPPLVSSPRSYRPFRLPALVAHPRCSLSSLILISRSPCPLSLSLLARSLHPCLS